MADCWVSMRTQQTTSKTSTHRIMPNNAMAVNAIETVSLLPWYTYTKKEMREIRIGARLKRVVNMIELTRAGRKAKKYCISHWSMSRVKCD